MNDPDFGAVISADHGPGSPSRRMVQSALVKSRRIGHIGAEKAGFIAGKD